MKKYVFILAFMLIAQVASAETYKIGKYIEVTPPKGVDVTFQIFEAFDPKEKVLMGWNGEELEYLFVTEKDPAGYKESSYWKGIEKELKKGTDNKKVKIVSEGKYKTDSGVKARYKIYSWVSDGEESVQMANLIKNKKIAQWVLVTPIDNSKINAVAKKAIKILKTSKLTK